MGPWSLEISARHQSLAIRARHQSLVRETPEEKEADSEPFTCEASHENQVR